MAFEFTDLHTLIVRAHDRHDIAMGKIVRITLRAAANRKFPLYKSDGSRLKLSATDRGWLLDLATSAEQQTEIRWWTKGPWPRLHAILVPEPKFWEWLQTELGSAEDKPVVSPVPASEVGPPEDHPVLVRTPGKRAERRKDKRTRAGTAIDALWPKGIPDKSILPNGPLCDQVSEWLKRDAEEQNVTYVSISDDTILRAAGRQR